MSNQHSGLARQLPPTNWGSFWKKEEKERLTLKALKLAVKNRGKLVTIGRCMKDLEGKIFKR